MRRETATSLINDSNNEQAGELLTNERGPELVPRFFNEPTPRMLTRHVSSTAVTASRSSDAKLCIREITRDHRPRGKINEGSVFRGRVSSCCDVSDRCFNYFPRKSILCRENSTMKQTEEKDGQMSLKYIQCIPFSSRYPWFFVNYPYMVSFEDKL